jgi:hypothetical protein
VAYVKGKTKNQILEELTGTAEPGSPVHEQQKMGILVRCTEDLEQRAVDLGNALGRATQVLDDRVERLTAAIEAASATSTRLTAMLVWLNIVLTAATFVGAVAAVAVLFR